MADGEDMLFKKKRKDKSYSKYPCSVFLHNALRFIKEGKPEVAYEEICWALVRAGDELSSEEKETFEKIKAERDTYGI